MTTFASWSDEQVIESMHKQADLCVEIMAMPEAERRAPRGKDSASPEQAGYLNALIAVQLEQEAIARGLI